MLNNTLPEWVTLDTHARTMRYVHMNDLMHADRVKTMRLSLPGLYADFSRQRMNDDTLGLLLALARACDLEGWRDRMFSGAPINTTENRAVLHTALRRPAKDSVMVDGENVMPFIHDVLNRMKTITDAVHSGAWTGHTGKRITTIINIGIGGSDLGPHMVVEALRPFHVDGITVKFVSNVDGTHLHNALQGCDPATTLFLIASKTFTTQETMKNAQTARAWLLAKLKKDDAIAKHFIALSTNEKAVTAFGINPDNMLPFRDWVGGRFSLWSSIGLSIALAVGFDHFRSLLDGANAMDRHFQTAPLHQNLPVLMGLIGVWNRNFMNCSGLAVLPYDQNLIHLPAFLQQVDMESNGKRVNHDGETLPYATAPIVFGEPGTNGQHAFYQMLHQGTDIVPCEFIGSRETFAPYADHHHILLANMIAQAQALMTGRSERESNNNPHQTFPGNRPSVTLLFDRMDAFNLGQLIALYEHRVFVQGIIWGINSFDQYGVELGKILANSVLDSGKSPESQGQIDPAGAALLSLLA